jgi:hypothetical protein
MGLDLIRKYQHHKFFCSEGMVDIDKVFMLTCPVCGKRFMNYPTSKLWKHMACPGDPTNSLNKFLWCCSSCAEKVTYEQLDDLPYKIIVYPHKLFGVLNMRGYFDFPTREVVSPP